MSIRSEDLAGAPQARDAERALELADSLAAHLYHIAHSANTEQQVMLSQWETEDAVALLRRLAAPTPDREPTHAMVNAAADLLAERQGDGRHITLADVRDALRAALASRPAGDAHGGSTT